MARRLGVLGGSFDPIHNGHVYIATMCAEHCGCERVELIPARTPAHKQDQEMAPPHHRLRMAEIAAAPYPHLEASDREIRRDGISFTVDTLEGIRAELPDWEILFIIGSDTVPELPTWHRIDRIGEIARIITVERPGFPVRAARELHPGLPEGMAHQIEDDVLRVLPPDVRSRDIRKAIAGGRPFHQWVDPGVAAYILEHELYGAKR